VLVRCCHSDCAYRAHFFRCLGKSRAARRPDHRGGEPGRECGVFGWEAAPGVAEFDGSGEVVGSRSVELVDEVAVVLAGGVEIPGLVDEREQIAAMVMGVEDLGVVERSGLAEGALELADPPGVGADPDAGRGAAEAGPPQAGANVVSHRSLGLGNPGQHEQPLAVPVRLLGLEALDVLPMDVVSAGPPVK
jgi:hypothetical protein